MCHDSGKLKAGESRGNSGNCSRYGASNIRVFGSVARGEAGDFSDLDLLTDLDHGRSLMDMGGLLMDLQAQLKVQIDLATEGMLRREINDRVLSEAVPL